MRLRNVEDAIPYKLVLTARKILHLYPIEQVQWGPRFALRMTDSFLASPISGEVACDSKTER